jgi:hypothetical protein
MRQFLHAGGEQVRQDVGGQQLGAQATLCRGVPSAAVMVRVPGRARFMVPRLAQNSSTGTMA